ncbi:hypothetical protein [Pseudofrankia saprophytica]|nr:hypothetical protein [Pseudofrankia saprophytica]
MIGGSQAARREVEAPLLARRPPARAAVEVPALVAATEVPALMPA